MTYGINRNDGRVNVGGVKQDQAERNVLSRLFALLIFLIEEQHLKFFCFGNGSLSISTGVANESVAGSNTDQGIPFQRNKDGYGLNNLPGDELRVKD